MRKLAGGSNSLGKTPPKTSSLGIDAVMHLVREGYIPFANVLRVIPWPQKKRDNENDVEHSFSLVFVGLALADRLGLDSAKVARYATYHDFVERYAGDTSAWDDEGLQTKTAREAEALARITDAFGVTPVIAQTIHAYEQQLDEEARFVYALDKLLALAVIVQGGGLFWKQAGISFDDFVEHGKIMLKKVQAHPLVAAWYQELINQIVADRHKYFGQD